MSTSANPNIVIALAANKAMRQWLHSLQHVWKNIKFARLPPLGFLSPVWFCDIGRHGRQAASALGEGRSLCTAGGLAPWQLSGFMMPPPITVFELKKLRNAVRSYLFGSFSMSLFVWSHQWFRCSSAYSQTFPEVPVWFGGANHEHRGSKKFRLSQGFCLIHLQWAERMSWDSLKLGFDLGWLQMENIVTHFEALWRVQNCTFVYLLNGDISQNYTQIRIQIVKCQDPLRISNSTSQCPEDSQVLTKWCLD